VNISPYNAQHAGLFGCPATADTEK